VIKIKYDNGLGWDWSVKWWVGLGKLDPRTYLICCPRPSCGSQLHVAALSIDGTVPGGQTDRRTSYRLLSRSPLQKLAASTVGPQVVACDFVGGRVAACTRTFQFGQKMFRFDSRYRINFFSIRQSGKFAACTLIISDIQIVSQELAYFLAETIQ